MVYARSRPAPRPRATAQLYKFDAPVGGWIANRNLSQPNQQGEAPGAEVLDNFFPTSTGIVMRRGSELYATLGNPGSEVRSLFSYKNGNNERFFGATDDTVYDITTVLSAQNYMIDTDDEDIIVTDEGDTIGQDSTGGLEVIIGAQNGNWSVVQFQTTGGVYLVLVNGEDPMWLFDGANWYPIEGTNLYNIPYNNETADFTAGETLTGATSGATATILRIVDNGTDGTFLVADVAEQPMEWTLDFDAEAAAFTVGSTLTGVTSEATATIESVTSDGTTGTLVLRDLEGTFEDNETITDDDGGEAVANGASEYSTGGMFQTGETITDGAGGEAEIAGSPVLVALGIEGVDVTDLNYVWSYKNRLFFVEKESLNAWYLPVDSVGGEADVFPLGGLFSKGGSLLFGASWSLDGVGLNEQCVFVTTEGEVAVFSGLGPESDDWSQVGLYQVGVPLGSKAHIKAGGDLVIATTIGFVPLSQAVSRAIAALSPGAISYKIEEAWTAAVDRRPIGDWQCHLWNEGRMVVVSPPPSDTEEPILFASNARTGSWARFTGWDARCFGTFAGQLFFGSSDGRVVLTNTSGLDEGSAYTASYLPLYDDLGSPGSLKVAKSARAVIRAPVPVVERVSGQWDFNSELPSAPSAPVVPSNSTWGSAVWGESVWGLRPEDTTKQQWVSVGGSGYALSVGLQMTSGSLVPSDAKVVRIDVTFETAGIVT